ncbi:MAG: hypothetical protein RIC35_21545 [Marinoscillum sp.]
MINSRIYLFTLLILAAVIAKGQTSALVSFDELSFDSDSEKNTLMLLNSGSSDFFSGLMVQSGVDSAQVLKWERSFNMRISKFKALKRPKKDSKYVKKIYEFVHAEFLRKYENVAYFNQIFQTGVYNCVTACALYGLVFDELGVPYVVKETPTHVYIIAYPETEQIGIETTDPIGGFKTFSPGYKEAFIGDLLRQKLIDNAELTAGVNTVFDKYYFTNKELGLKELVGLQYYNKGISAFNDENYPGAFKELQKAYFFHDTDEIKEVLEAAGILTVSQLQYDKLEDVNMLTFLTRVDDPNIGSDEILGEFARLMNKQLLNQNDTQYVHRAYDKLSSQITDSTLQVEIDFYYNYERGRMLYNRGNYVLAFPFIRNAYQTKPNNFDAENLLVGNINNTMVASAYKSDELLSLVDDLYDEFPNLTSNAHLGALRMGIYLEAMSDAYLSKDVKSAEKYQLKFEAAVDQYHYRFQDFAVGKAYSNGITYYFRKGWYKSARELLNSGLKYAPNNSELKMRKYYLDRAQN